MVQVNLEIVLRFVAQCLHEPLEARQSGFIALVDTRVRQHLRAQQRQTEAAEYLRDNPEARFIMNANYTERAVQKLRSQKTLKHKILQLLQNHRLFQMKNLKNKSKTLLKLQIPPLSKSLLKNLKKKTKQKKKKKYQNS